MQQIFNRWLKINAVMYGLLIIVGGGIILYLHMDVSGRVETVVGQRAALNLRSQGFVSLATLRDESTKSAEAQKQLYILLPKRDDLFSFAKTVDTIAQKRKLNVNFTFETETAGSGNTPSSIRFSMSVVGEYANIVNFLKDIESQPTLLTLDQFDITQSGDGMYGASVNGAVYFRA